MARRKHIKRIDPRHFLHETTNRVERRELQEGCPHEEHGEEIDISGPGVELHVDNVDDLPPDEAFAAGLAVARDTIDQLLGSSEEDLPEEEIIAIAERLLKEENLDELFGRKTRQQKKVDVDDSDLGEFLAILAQRYAASPEGQSDPRTTASRNQPEMTPAQKRKRDPSPDRDVTPWEPARRHATDKKKGRPHPRGEDEGWGKPVFGDEAAIERRRHTGPRGFRGWGVDESKQHLKALVLQELQHMREGK